MFKMEEDRKCLEKKEKEFKRLNWRKYIKEKEMRVKMERKKR